MMNKERLQDVGYTIKKTHGIDRVADKAGVPRRTVVKFCNDFTKITMRDLERIMSAVNELEKGAQT